MCAADRKWHALNSRELMTPERGTAAAHRSPGGWVKRGGHISHPSLCGNQWDLNFNFLELAGSRCWVRGDASNVAQLTKYKWLALVQYYWFATNCKAITPKVYANHSNDHHPFITSVTMCAYMMYDSPLIVIVMHLLFEIVFSASIPPPPFHASC